MKWLRAARPARIARIAIAATVLCGVTFGILDVANPGAGLALRVVASWQLFPAVGRAIATGTLALGAAALLVLLLSLVFGRWYCAALCPLGTLQDLASLPRRNRRGFARPRTAMRVLALVLVLGAAAIGAAGLASWLDPWSLFGRFAAYDLQSVLRLAAREDLPGLVPSTVLASGAAVAAILAASFASGRWFCGNLCPVGSTLGLLNSLAPLRLRLDSGECIACGECASVCRASCVDSAAKRLDPSRCVYCLACLEVCPTGALYYGRPRPAPSAPASSRISRARFLAALGGGAAALMVALVPGRAFASKALGVRATGLGAPFPVLPPGARSLERFVGTCVACGACISVCPSRVLQPSLGQLGLIGLMAPRLDHGVSYCQYDCIACIDACPSGALGRMGLERKRLTKIGDATLVRDRCIVITNLTKCGACAECCPTGAVRMVAAGDGLPEPVFTSSICIGCGACHHACPVRPDRAISVSGLAVQALAEPPSTKLFDQGPSVPAAGGAGTAKGAVKDAFPF